MSESPKSPWVARPALDRRALLRGAGAALALPWLEAMAPVRRRSPSPALRYAALFCPNGMLPSAWRPTATGTEFELTPTLAPLAPVRDSIVVLGNLHHRASHAGEGHYVKTTAWLSGAPVKRTGGRDLRVGTSIDQVLANEIGGATPIDALVLGNEPVRNRVDMGYSTVYGANVSWRTPTVPATREIEPRRVFERLVRWSGLRADPRKRAVLDLVHEEAKRLRGRVGGADRAKLDEYFESVRTLEARIDGLDRRDAPPAAPEELRDDASYPERVRLMLELLLLAFRTDATRVATFMFGNSVSGQNFSFLDGVEGGHHPLSHHENKDDKKRQYALINRWHVAEYAWLLGELGRIEEDDGTLLDRSVVQFGSGLADGNRHDPKDLPLVLGGGVFASAARGGARHVRQERLTPLCNVYASVLEAFGEREASFGDSTGPLVGL